VVIVPSLKEHRKNLALFPLRSGYISHAPVAENDELLAVVDGWFIERRFL